MKIKTKDDRRRRIQLRQRKRISGSTERPRLSVFRSVTHIYAQVIDDLSGKTLASASSVEPAVKGTFEKGVTGGNIEYLLRYTSVWGNLSGAPIGVDSSRYTDTTGDLTSPVAPWGWAAHYQRLASYFTNQDAQIMQLARGRLLQVLAQAHHRRETLVERSILAD